MNFEGTEENVQFKRGNTHYDKTGKIKYTSIYCSKWKYRLVKTNEVEIQDTEQKESKSKLSKNIKSREDCDCYYRFKADSDGYFKLVTYEEAHSHELSIKVNTLTAEMINDVRSFNKRSKIIDIKEYLDKKHATEVNYMSVYNLTRKIFPQFEQYDAKNLIEFFKKESIYYKYKTNQDSNELTKLFFSTRKMQLQY